MFSSEMLSQKKTGAKAGRVKGERAMLCRTVLPARNDNYVSDLRLFDETNLRV